MSAAAQPKHSQAPEGEDPRAVIEQRLHEKPPVSLPGRVGLHGRCILPVLLGLPEQVVRRIHVH